MLNRNTLITNFTAEKQISYANVGSNLSTESEQEDAMLKKSYMKTGRICRVTFKLPMEVNAKSVALLGEFNNWDQSACPMNKLKNGDFSTTVSLSTGQTYRFRYLLDDKRWENDWAPDAYIANSFGSEDSVVTV